MENLEAKGYQNGLRSAVNIAQRVVDQSYSEAVNCKSPRDKRAAEMIELGARRTLAALQQIAEAK